MCVRGVEMLFVRFGSNRGGNSEGVFPIGLLCPCNLNVCVLYQSIYKLYIYFYDLYHLYLLFCCVCVCVCVHLWNEREQP